MSVRATGVAGVVAGLLLGGLDAPSAVISGRVTDATGAPLAAAIVTARLVAEAGLDPVSERETQTNDRGDYELRGLEPGPYVIIVAAHHITWPTTQDRSWGGRLVPVTAPDDATMRTSTDGRFVWAPTITSEPPPMAGGREAVFVTTGYPGVTDPASYADVEVEAGDELRHIDVVMATAPRVGVRGVALGPDGPVSQVRIRLVRDAVVGDDQMVQATTDVDGRFEFLSAPPGTYELQAFRVPGDGHVVRPDPEGYWALDTLTVADRDVDDIIVRLERGVRVRAEIELGETPPDGLRVPPVRLEATITTRPSAVSGGDQRVSGRTFEASGLAPGKYIWLANRGWSIESVRMNGRDVTGDVLEVGTDDIGGIVVTMGTQVNSVSGLVVLPEGMAAGQVGVVIMPVDPDKRVTSRANVTMRRIDVEADGSYRFENLMPGRYFVAAVPSDGLRRWPTASAVSRIEALADTVTITTGQVLTHNLAVRR